MNAKPTLKRKVELGNREYIVFGSAPWILVPVPENKEKQTPACYMVMEASLLAHAGAPSRRLMYNALASKANNGAYIGVVFTGEEGKARCNEVITYLNFKFG